MSRSTTENLGVTLEREGTERDALSAEINRVRARLERHTDVDAVEVIDPGEVPPNGAARSSILDHLVESFRLSPFERSVVVLCAGAELSSGFGDKCAAAHGDPSRRYPTFGLALATLEGAHWSALTPSGPLRHWRLVDVGPGDVLVDARLRLDERILHYLVEAPAVDERLSGIAEPPRSPRRAELPESQRQLVRQVAECWSRAEPGEWPVVSLYGPAPAERLAVAETVCLSLGLGVCIAAADALPMTTTEVDVFTRIWEREAALSQSALLLDTEHADGPGSGRAHVWRRLLDTIMSPLLVLGRDPIRPRLRASMALEVARPEPRERRDLWLASAGGRLSVAEADSLAVHFPLGTAEIRDAWLAAAAAGGGAHDAWQACRAQTRGRIDTLAARIETTASWDDLVLPATAMERLHAIAAHTRGRSRVLHEWGFASMSQRGLGLSALFAGPSGTGKTLAAEVLANELRLDLYRVDLSQVVSKYIGETEKNLRRVFDAAEEGGAVLLFDEADALFGRRSEVKDSHDRYANVEVGYLLQKMEAYRGLAILTTNMKDALDTAFLRRLRFVVAFKVPDFMLRDAIWRRVFPPDTPTEGLDHAALSRLNISGGLIKNIALSAAFLAADEGAPVRMAHILRATRAEYEKLERPLTDSELVGWRVESDRPVSSPT